VPDHAVATAYRLTTEAKLKRFAGATLAAVGVEVADAAIAADVLVAADLRGIESHGVARLARDSIARLRDGTLAATPDVRTVRETPTSLVLDAGNGLGHPVATRAMKAVIAKADLMGTAFGAVRGSNHFGIAGYYAMLALEHDMIGIASTNAVRSAAPTFGRDVMVGTNPWAYAVPAMHEPAFVLDFATTAVSRGTLEARERARVPLEPGWALDTNGAQTLRATEALTGALVPLGGLGMDNGGHKGYGLGMLADIMCAVLAGGTFGTDVPLAGETRGGAISHFFGAIKIDALRDLAAFKADMDAELRAFKDSAKAPGVERIYVAGEIEYEKTLAYRRDGVPVHLSVWNELEKLSAELAIPFELAR